MKQNVLVDKVLALLILVMVSCGGMEKQKNYFVDSRDGNVYPFALFGEDIWMTENLRYKTDSCFMPVYLRENYGFLYTWEDACKACSPGWHLPDEQEYFALEIALGLSKDSLLNVSAQENAKIAQKMKLAAAWGEKDSMDSGWNALPAGVFPRMRTDIGATHHSMGRTTGIWVNKDFPELPTFATSLNIEKGRSRLYRSGTAKTWGLSVRCVKDKPQ